MWLLNRLLMVLNDVCAEMEHRVLRVSAKPCLSHEVLSMRYFLFYTIVKIFYNILCLLVYFAFCWLTGVALGL